MKVSIVSSAALRRTSALAVKACKARGVTLATAESCTGGLIAKAVTDVAGSSSVLCGGFVTYTNAVKIGVLGVSAEVIASHTEVSHACAAEMALRAREKAESDYALSTTGFAGPTGGTELDPVGTVYVGFATPHGVRTFRILVENASRSAVRTTAAAFALRLLLDELG